MNIQKLMKQMGQVQAKMAEAQEKLGSIEVVGSAGGGMVKATANGRQEVIRIAIDPKVVDPGDVDMLEDMILGAVKEAQRLAREQSAAEMERIGAGMGLPPGLF
jgi:DNA-binding YbaB/EbfC family protein